MREKLLNILVCPVCHGSLKLTVSEQAGDEIYSGSLHCAKCRVSYAIEDSIPQLLPPDKC